MPLGRRFRFCVPRYMLSVRRWMPANFSTWVACGCAGELYSLVSIGAGPYGSKKTEPPTILAWEYGLCSPMLDLGREKYTVGEDLERLKQRLPLLEYLQRSEERRVGKEGRSR